MFDPKNAVNERIILLSRAELGPDFNEAVRGTQFRLRHVRVVVPNRFAVPGRRIRDRGGDDQEQTKQPDLLRTFLAFSRYHSVRARF